MMDSCGCYISISISISKLYKGKIGYFTCAGVPNICANVPNFTKSGINSRFDLHIQKKSTYATAVTDDDKKVLELNNKKP